jgi:hypothetical protein
MTEINAGADNGPVLTPISLVDSDLALMHAHRGNPRQTRPRHAKPSQDKTRQAKLDQGAYASHRVAKCSIDHPTHMYRIINRGR